MEVAGRSKVMDSYRKSIKHGVTSGLEFKLDELRKELASSHNGEIFPHSVLSGQQISIISTKKPSSTEEACLKVSNSSLVCLAYHMLDNQLLE